MSEKEINTVIADFMGMKIGGLYIYREKLVNGAGEESYLDYTELYTESVDSLLPVIKKMNMALSIDYYSRSNDWDVNHSLLGSGAFESLSYGLAKSCADAILKISAESNPDKP